MPFQRHHIRDFEAASFFQKIHEGKSYVHYPSGAVIYAQGAIADAVYFVQSGQVNLTVCSPKGQQAIIALLKPGDFLGEGCLAGQTTRTATATAVRDSTAIRVEKAAMARLLRTEPKFSEIFLSYLLKRKLALEADLVNLTFNLANKRLGRALLLLAGIAKGQDSATIIPRVTHETLAQMIGATRSQVSTLMSEFRKKGYIDYDGGLKVNESLVDFVFNE